MDACLDAGAQQRLSATPVAFQMCEASLRLFCATSEPGPRERARAVSRPGAQQFSAVYKQLPIPVLCMGLLVHGAVCLHLTVLEKEISCLVLTQKGRACRQPSALWVNTHTHTRMQPSLFKQVPFTFIRTAARTSSAAHHRLPFVLHQGLLSALLWPRACCGYLGPASPCPLCRHSPAQHGLPPHGLPCLGSRELCTGAAGLCSSLCWFLNGAVRALQLQKVGLPLSC